MIDSGMEKLMNNKSAVMALTALGHEIRLAVFRLLVQAGPGGLAATRIAASLGIAPSSLSFHLKELTNSGIAIQTKAGRSLIYSANFETMNGLLGFLTENCCGGNPCTPLRAPVCATDAAG
jgi:ArsR family transcriptional regulator